MAGIFPPLLQVCHIRVSRPHPGDFSFNLLIFMLIAYTMPQPYTAHPPLDTPFALLQQGVQDALKTLPPGHPAPTLVAASKTQPTSRIEEAIRLGIRHFGENRIQDLLSKWPELKARHPDVVLHLIGPLQSNKAAEAVAWCDIIETIDRTKIADAIAAECAKQGKRPHCLIQVNTGEEPQKAGVIPAEADALIHYATETAGLHVTGLMCIPPVGQHPAPHFALLRHIGERNGLTTLSMGMSGDYKEAIRMGATHIRLGTALFGERTA